MFLNRGSHVIFGKHIMQHLEQTSTNNNSMTAWVAATEPETFLF